MSLTTTQLDALRVSLIICCSSIDEVLERWNTLPKSRPDLTYSFSDHIAHEMAEFISQYQLSKLGRDHWGDANQNIRALDTHSFEEEVKFNFLNNIENERVVYRNYIDYQIGEFLPKVKAYKEWSNTYDNTKAIPHIKDYDLEYLESGITEDILGRNYTRKGLTDLFSNYLNRFIYDLDDFIKTLARFDKISNSKITTDKSPSTNINNKFEWKGDKTDLAELIWAIVKSGRVIDITTGKNITQVDLSRHIEVVFGISLDIPGLMKGRMKTYKVTSDGNTFTKTLCDLVNERAADS
jgi:hypothetical protein